MTLRLDQTLLDLFNLVGPVWFFVALAVLAYAFFGGYVRALGLTMLLLVSAQCWYLPCWFIGRGLRWWLLIILCLRGVLLSTRVPRPPGERSLGRTFGALLGAVAIASAMWSDRPEFSFGVAASFVLSLVAAYVVLWRVLDIEDVSAAACRGAVVLAILLFGSGFVATVVAVSLDDPYILRATGWGGRYAGILFNANLSGVIAMSVLPCLVAAPSGWLGRLRLLRVPAIALASAALILSGSRGSLLGTLLALLVLFLYRFGAGAVFTVALGTIGIYLAATYISVEDLEASSAAARFTRTKHIGTLSGRVDLWDEGLVASEGNRLIGLGWGSSRMLHGADAEDSLESGNVRGASNLHSTHVQILVDLGALGLGLFWANCFFTLAAGWSILRQRRTESSSVNVMVLASYVAAFADTFLHGSVLSTGGPSALIFWSSSAMILKEGDRIRRGAAPPWKVNRADGSDVPLPAVQPIAAQPRGQRSLVVPR
ncbi:MAG: O-antigen ligase family protein [Planctomycetes bacterium]|nr:O-antigen ligase family protein [Planctomycetota bacterium]